MASAKITPGGTARAAQEEKQDEDAKEKTIANPPANKPELVTTAPDPVRAASTFLRSVEDMVTANGLGVLAAVVTIVFVLSVSQIPFTNWNVLLPGTGDR